MSAETTTTLGKLAPLRGPAVLTVLCLAPLLLWARSAPLEARFSGSFASLTSVAVLCAFAGTAAFALNLVLGARLRVVEALFGGLDSMYKAHRVVGQVAFTLLLGHVVFILAGRATISTGTAVELLGPGAGWTVFAGVLAFGAMAVSILTTLFVRLGHEVFVYVQRAFGFIFLAASYHVFTTSGAKAQSVALSRYMAVLAALGLVAFAYRSLFGNVLVRRRRYRITAVNRLDEFVTEIVMEPLGRAARLHTGPVRLRHVPLARPQRRAAPVGGVGGAPGLLVSSRGGRQPVPSLLDHRVPGRADPESHRQGDRRLHTRPAQAGSGSGGGRRGPLRLVLALERAERPADLAGWGDRRHAFPEHGPQPRRPKRTVDRLLLLRRARREGALPRRAPGDCEPSRRLSRHRRRISPRSASRTRTRTSNPRMCSSAGRPP